MRGGEVSNRAVLEVLRAARSRGIAASRLMRGLCLPQEAGGRSPWGAYVTLLDRLEETLGGAEGIRRFAFDLVRGMRPLRILGDPDRDLWQIYFFGCEYVCRVQYHDVLGARLERAPDGSFRLERRIAEEYRGSLPFFHASSGAWEAYPTLLGLPPARVEAEIAPRRSVYRISFPPRAAPGAGGDPPGDPLPRKELREAVGWAFDPAALLAGANLLGPGLVLQPNPEALAGEVFQVMERLFCSRSAALWARARPGAPLLLLGETPPLDRGVLVERPLSIGGRDLGKIVVDLPAGAGGRSVPLFEALVPWIAAGLENALRAAPRRCARPPRGGPPGRAGRIDAAAGRWALTIRQRQVLRLLLAGSTNRELAAALGTSIKTVEAHLSEILAKSGCANRTSLVAQVLGGDAPPCRVGRSPPRRGSGRRGSRPRGDRDG